MHALLHGFEFLFLLIVEYGSNLAVHILPHLFHFGLTICPWGRLVLHERLYFLLVLGEYGLDLGLLIGRQVQFACHALQHSVGIHAPGTADALLLLLRLGWLRWSCVVLRDCSYRNGERNQRT